MIFFAYSAAGHFTPTLGYGVIDKTGKLVRYDQFDAPYASMVHDFMVTRDYVLFPVLPLTGSMPRAMAGKPAYAWEADKRSYVGVMRRDASVASVRWFECDPCYVFHPMNAYQDGDKIVGDVMQYEAAPLFTDPDGRPGDPAKAVAKLTRWTFDLAANTDSFKRETIDDLSAEFPRFDERFAGLDYRHGFFAASSARKVLDRFDMLAHIDLKTGKRSVYQLPAGDVDLRADLRAAREGASLRATVICSRPFIAAPNTAAISPCSTRKIWNPVRWRLQNSPPAFRSVFTATGGRRHEAGKSRCPSARTSSVVADNDFRKRRRRGQFREIGAENRVLRTDSAHRV